MTNILYSGPNKGISYLFIFFSSYFLSSYHPEQLATSLARKGLIFNQPNSAGVMIYRLLPLMTLGLMEYKFMGELKGDEEERQLAACDRGPKGMGNSSIRSAIFFLLLIVLISFLGIYLKGHKEKRPVSIRNKDWGHSVQKTADGGYVIAGVSWRLGGWLSDVYLIKTKARGSVLWSKTFGKGDVDTGNSVKQTLDLGYIIAGTTWSSDGTQSDIYLIKTDINGNEAWSRTYGGNGRDEGYSVCQTADGGYIVAGRTNSFGKGEHDIYLIKTDKDGNEAWSRTYGGSGTDEGYSVCQTADGGYIVAGRTDSFSRGEDDVYLIKTDADGDMAWSGTYGGKGRDRGNSVCRTDDGGYVVAGTTWSYSGKYSDVYLIKTDGNGRELWHKTFGGRFGDYGHSVQQTADGGFIVAGNTWPFGRIGSSKVYLLKLDRNGSKVWARTIGAGGSEFGLSVCRAGDGGYVVAGKTVSIEKGDDDVYLMKVLGDGTEAWSRRIGRGGKRPGPN